MNEETKLLLHNIVAAVAVVGLVVLVALGKATTTELLAFAGGLLVRPGLPAPAKSE